MSAFEQPYPVVRDVLRPTVFYQSPRPFRVRQTDPVIKFVCNNNVFFYGYHPPCYFSYSVFGKNVLLFFVMGAVPEQKQEIQMQEARIISVFCYGCRPRLACSFCFFVYYSILFFNWQDFFAHLCNVVSHNFLKKFCANRRKILANEKLQAFELYYM